MATDESCGRGSGEKPDDDLSAFLNLLNELKATGCSLLVVGDAPRDVFARASGRLLGDADVVRYRLLAVTDATAQSVADRLPNPNETPRPLTETTRIVNHAGAPRSVTAATSSSAPPKLAGIEETYVSDAELRGLESALCDAMDEIAGRAPALQPGDLRVGIDSVDPLVYHHDAGAVQRCLDAVGEHARARDAMAHYVFPRSYDDSRVRDLETTVDAVVELRTVDAAAYGHDAEQRWHVPERDVTTEWLPL